MDNVEKMSELAVKHRCLTSEVRTEVDRARGARRPPVRGRVGPRAREAADEYLHGAQAPQGALDSGVASESASDGQSPVTAKLAAEKLVHPIVHSVTVCVPDTTHECRSCGRYVEGWTDGTFAEMGWNRIANIDGPNALCPTCSDKPDVLGSLRAAGYTRACIGDALDPCEGNHVKPVGGRV